MAEMVWVKDQYDEGAVPMRVTLEKFEKSLGAKGFRLCDPPERPPTAGEFKQTPAEVRREEMIANRKTASSESVSDPADVRKQEIIANRKKASPAPITPAEKRRKKLAAERQAKAVASVDASTASFDDVLMSTTNPSSSSNDEGKEGGVSALVGGGDNGPKPTSTAKQVKRTKKATPKEG